MDSDDEVSGEESGEEVGDEEAAPEEVDEELALGKLCFHTFKMFSLVKMPVATALFQSIFLYLVYIVFAICLNKVSCFYALFISSDLCSRH
jgi:hypothetical protein